MRQVRGSARQVRIVDVIGSSANWSALKSDVGEEHHLVLEGCFRLRQVSFEAVQEPDDYPVWDGAFQHEAGVVGDELARVRIITPGPAGAGIAGDRAE